MESLGSQNSLKPKSNAIEFCAVELTKNGNLENGGEALKESP